MTWETTELEAAIAAARIKPRADDDYRGYLERCGVLGRGFAYSELVSRWRGNKKLPPKQLWPRMALTLAAANELRQHWLDWGGLGLAVAAAYRPSGGAANSRHKHNAALDLDVFGADRKRGKDWFQCATRFWSMWARELRLGFGLYTWWKGSLGGIRVHIDTHYLKDAPLRQWQGVSVGLSKFRKPWRVEGRWSTLATKLAFEAGLDVPTRADI